MVRGGPALRCPDQFQFLLELTTQSANLLDDFLAASPDNVSSISVYCIGETNVAALPLTPCPLLGTDGLAVDRMVVFVKQHPHRRQFALTAKNGCGRWILYPPRGLTLPQLLGCSPLGQLLVVHLLLSQPRVFD